MEEPNRRKRGRGSTRVSRAVPPARERVSGADVERMIKGAGHRAATATAAKRSSIGRQQTARGISAAGAVALFVGSALFAGGTISLQEDQRQAASIQAEAEAELSGQAAELEREADAVPSGQEAVAAVQSREAAVGERAETVAALQDRFAVILHAGNNEQGAVPRSARAEAQHRRSLAPYFASSSWVVTQEGTAYSADRLVPIGQEQVDPRFAWHVQSGPNGKYLDPARYSWTVAAVNVDAASLTVDGGDRARTEVLWLCERRDGTLLAWARASAEPGQLRFTDLVVGSTAVGESSGEQDLVPGVPPVKIGSEA